MTAGGQQVANPIMCFFGSIYNNREAAEKHIMCFCSNLCFLICPTTIYPKKMQKHKSQQNHVHTNQNTQQKALQKHIKSKLHRCVPSLMLATRINFQTRIFRRNIFVHSLNQRMLFEIFTCFNILIFKTNVISERKPHSLSENSFDQEVFYYFQIFPLLWLKMNVDLTSLTIRKLNERRHFLFVFVNKKKLISESDNIYQIHPLIVFTAYLSSNSVYSISLLSVILR
ncbi:hypothetical protein AB205_0064560, partial [Aquarana catesbeiana]